MNTYTDRAIETQHSSGCLGAFEVRWVQICPLQPPSLIYLSLSLLIWKHEELCQCKLSFRTSLKILRSGLSLTHRINLPCGPQSIFSDWVDEQRWVRPRTGLGVDWRRREEILAAPNKQEGLRCSLSPPAVWDQMHIEKDLVLWEGVCVVSWISASGFSLELFTGEAQS